MNVPDLREEEVVHDALELPGRSSAGPRGRWAACEALRCLAETGKVASKIKLNNLRHRLRADKT